MEESRDLMVVMRHAEQDRGLCARRARGIAEISEVFNSGHGTQFSPENFAHLSVAAEESLRDEDRADMLRNDPADVAEQHLTQEFVIRVISIFEKDSQIRSALMRDGDARGRSCGYSSRRFCGK